MGKKSISKWIINVATLKICWRTFLQGLYPGVNKSVGLFSFSPPLLFLWTPILIQVNIKVHLWRKKNSNKSQRNSLSPNTGIYENKEAQFFPFCFGDLERNIWAHCMYSLWLQQSCKSKALFSLTDLKSGSSISAQQMKI